MNISTNATCLLETAGLYVYICLHKQIMARVTMVTLRSQMVSAPSVTDDTYFPAYLRVPIY
jgi:hypothetical protein